MKIVFFHMNQLGDLLFSLPVLSGARATWPEARLSCVARPSIAPLIKATGLINDVVERLADGPAATIRLAGQIRKEKYDRALFFSESPGMLLTGAAAGIPERAGFSTASLFWLLNRRVPRSGVPSLSNNRRLAEGAGIMHVPKTYCGILKIASEDRERALRWLSVRGMKAGNVFVIAPGASRRRAEKHWERERWQRLARKITEAGYSAVATGAPHERGYLSRVAETVFPPDDGLVGLAALMSVSRAVISIDSGAMHLGAALGKPVIALYGPTDPSQIGPQPLERHQIIKRQRMDDIQVDDVWEAVRRIE